MVAILHLWILKVRFVEFNLPLNSSPSPSSDSEIRFLLDFFKGVIIYMFSLNTSEQDLIKQSIFDRWLQSHLLCNERSKERCVSEST
ncbi:hypothetical protein I79_024069 [Cricetulus griseus]|uniref:Uncharacterized protein n=1 Tax=Cricetulus griseus TaxID=10029 RepID=G3IJN3_CRIGR|nr:hypothetical protein I79_024069 [Cricetulus griseus]